MVTYTHGQTHMHTQIKTEKKNKEMAERGQQKNSLKGIVTFGLAILLFEFIIMKLYPVYDFCNRKYVAH